MDNIGVSFAAVEDAVSLDVREFVLFFFALLLLARANPTQSNPIDNERNPTVYNETTLSNALSNNERHKHT